MLLQFDASHLQLEVVRLRRRQQNFRVRRGDERQSNRFHLHCPRPRLAAQLVQFEQRRLRCKLRFSRLALQRQLSRLDDACFQLWRKSRRVALHKHLAQLFEAVGDFLGRRRLLLRSEEIVGKNPRSCRQRRLELREA